MPNNSRILLIGDRIVRDLIEEVKAIFGDQRYPQCVVGQKMYSLADAQQLKAELVVLFLSGPSHNPKTPAYTNEKKLVALMAKCQTPCIVVYHYRLDAPEYLREGTELNAVVSFVPSPPLGFATRVDDFSPKNMRNLKRENRAAAIADAIATYTAQCEATEVAA